MVCRFIDTLKGVKVERERLQTCTALALVVIFINSRPWLLTDGFMHRSPRSRIWHASPGTLTHPTALEGLLLPR